jgi:hypothetical protein
LVKRIAVLTVLAASLAGCGGGKGATENLVAFTAGTKWVYQFNGTVTLPAGQGGGTQNVQTKSTFTMEVAAVTSKDANNADVNILDRKFDLFLLDGREIKANLRLYFTQSALGVFVHGVNNAMGDTIDPAQDKFVPSTANPPFQFLYLPNPANGQQISYANPLGVAPAASYFLSLGTTRVPVKVPAGDFLAKSYTITENFSQISLTSQNSPADPGAGFVPDVGIVSGHLTAILPDGTRVEGTIVLQNFTH